MLSCRKYDKEKKKFKNVVRDYFNRSERWNEKWIKNDIVLHDLPNQCQFGAEQRRRQVSRQLNESTVLAGGCLARRWPHRRRRSLMVERRQIAVLCEEEEEKKEEERPISIKWSFTGQRILKCYQWKKFPKLSGKWWQIGRQHSIIMIAAQSHLHYCTNTHT